MGVYTSETKAMSSGDACKLLANYSRANENIAWYARAELADAALLASQAAGEGAMIHALASALGIPASYLENRINPPSWKDRAQFVHGKFDVPVPFGLEPASVLREVKGTLVAKIDEYSILTLAPAKSWPVYTLERIYMATFLPKSSRKGVVPERHLKRLQEIFQSAKPFPIESKMH